MRNAPVRLTADQARYRNDEIAHSLNAHPTEGTMTFVGWGGRHASITGRMTPLGHDYGRNARTPRRGLRRAVYDFCFGYVSGFPVKDIIWYLLTRSLNYRKRPLYMKRWEEEMRKSHLTIAQSSATL